MLRQSTPTQVRNPSPPNPLIRAQRLQSSLTGLGPMIPTHQNHWRQPTPKPFMPPPQSQPKPPQFQWAQMQDGHWVEIRVGSQGTLPLQDRYPPDQAGAGQPQMSQNKGYYTYTSTEQNQETQPVARPGPSKEQNTETLVNILTEDLSIMGTGLKDPNRKE